MKIMFCIMIASFVTGISAAEVRINVKRGNRTATPSHVCEVETASLAGFSVVHKWFRKNIGIELWKDAHMY